MHSGGRKRRQTFAVALLALAALGGCSARTLDPPDAQGGNGAGSAPGGIVIEPTGRCSDQSLLKCRKVDCPADSVPSTTSVSGKVYDPAGKVPLYNAVVYVAEDKALVDLNDRAQCEDCGVHFPQFGALAVALTKPDGSFKLTDVPVGKEIPLTVQLGKWRRTVKIPYVAPCTNTQLEPELTRLPRNSTEGHLPKIAVTTGGSDALECLLHRIGVDADEFTPESGGGRVNLWAGYNAATSMLSRGQSVALPSAHDLWADADRMLGYDMILMSCEGNDNLWNQPDDDDLPEGVTERRTPAMHLEVRKYADLGGRIFGSHWHHRWINSGETTPDNQYPKVAAFSKTSARPPPLDNSRSRKPNTRWTRWTTAWPSGGSTGPTPARTRTTSARPTWCSTSRSPRPWRRRSAGAWCSATCTSRSAGETSRGSRSPRAAT
ncbi:MAG: hypothetical protein K0R38_1959 [Polyangiaceae bacterium]|nr:hypothetical protein [Polyangiaceae bacterium]